MSKDVQPANANSQQTPKVPYLMERTSFNELFFQQYYGITPEVFDEKFLIVYLDDEQQEWIDLEEWKLVRFKDALKAH